MVSGWGATASLIPALSVCVINVMGILLHALTWYEVTRNQYAYFILTFVFVGQALVWASIRYLRRCEGWESGITFYLWAGGFFTALAVCATAIFPLALLPWLAPIVASTAKRQLVRRKTAEVKAGKETQA